MLQRVRKVFNTITWSKLSCRQIHHLSVSEFLLPRPTSQVKTLTITETLQAHNQTVELDNSILPGTKVSVKHNPTYCSSVSAAVCACYCKKEGGMLQWIEWWMSQIVCEVLLIDPPWAQFSEAWHSEITQVRQLSPNPWQVQYGS